MLVRPIRFAVFAFRRLEPVQFIRSLHPSAFLRRANGRLRRVAMSFGEMKRPPGEWQICPRYPVFIGTARARRLACKPVCRLAHARSACLCGWSVQRARPGAFKVRGVACAGDFMMLRATGAAADVDRPKVSRPTAPGNQPAEQNATRGQNRLPAPPDRDPAS